MSIFSKRKLGLVVAAATLGTGSFSAPVYAEDVIEEVVVTGSRIPRTGFDTMLPANVISSEFMERRGYTNVADALNEVTSFGGVGSGFAGGEGDPDDSDQNSFSTGQNFVNFFGLGSQRTLTLVNGRRFVSSSAPSLFTNQNPGVQVDLNMIPSSMVERVETVSVGGAPIYGADAIAGTVNLILKDDFEGLEISTSYGEAMDEGDMGETTFELLYGGSFDNGRGSLVVGLEINDREGIIQADRDFLADGWQWRVPATDTGFDRELIFQGTANIVSNGGVVGNIGDANCLGVFGADCVVPSFGWGAPTTDADGNPVYLAFQPDGSIGPYDTGSPTGDAVWSSGGEGIFLPNLTSLYTPVNRKIATAFANYELTDNIEAFAEFYVAESEAEELVNQPAYQSGFFGEESARLLIDSTHPLLTPAARGTLNDLGLAQFALHRASTDLGDRSRESQNNLWRVVAGFRGDFEIADRTVSWDAAWIKGESEQDSQQVELITNNFLYALDVVDVGNGPQCRVVADPTSRPTSPGAPFDVVPPTAIFDNCLPLDVFGEGRASQESISYVTALATANAKLTQEVISINANAALFDLPAGEFSFALGFENRKETAFFGTDGVTELGLGRSAAIDETNGEYETDEWYAEFYAPIVSPDMDIPLVYSASVEGAFRQVDNSLAGKDDVHTIGGRWAPIEDIEFRGNVTRSVRAPSITELFLPLSDTFSFAADPCDQSNVNDGPNPAARRANCIADGITDPDNFSSNVRQASVNGKNGGNLGLNNEIADATTYGVVLRPRFIPDFTMSIDYVEIEIEEAIESFTLTQIMESCYDASSFPNTFCDQFTRGASGQLPPTNAFTSGFVNAGIKTYKGTQVEFDWFSDLKSWPVLNKLDNPGSLQIHGNMSFPTETETLILGAVVDELNLAYQPEESVQMNFTYFWNNLTVLWQVRYIGETVIENDVSDTKYPENGYDEVFLNNMGVTYEFNERVTLNLNINNVLDWEPKKERIAGGDYVSLDTIGRFVRAGIKVSL